MSEKFEGLYKKGKYQECLQTARNVLSQSGLRLDVLRFAVLCSDHLKQFDDCKRFAEIYLSMIPCDTEVIKIKIQILKSNRQFVELSEYLDYLTSSVPISIDQINNQPPNSCKKSGN